MPLICHVYTMYIPCIYNSRFDIPVIYQGYSLYILHGISSVYTVYIQFICIVYFVYIQVYYILHPVAGIVEEGGGAGARLPTCGAAPTYCHAGTATRAHTRARLHVRAHPSARPPCGKSDCEKIPNTLMRALLIQ